MQIPLLPRLVHIPSHDDAGKHHYWHLQGESDQKSASSVAHQGMVSVCCHYPEVQKTCKTSIYLMLTVFAQSCFCNVMA